MATTDGTDDAFRSIVEGLSFGVCVFCDGERVFANEEYARQHGFNNVAAALESREMAGDAEQGLREWCEMPERLDEPALHRFRLERKDGSAIYLEAQYSRVTFGGRSCLASVTRDVTSGVTVLRDLEDRERMFHSLFEAAPVGIALSGRDRVTTQVNPALVAMLGVPSEEIVGKRLSAFELDRAQRGSVGKYDLLVSGDLESFVISRDLVRATGETVSTETISAAVRDTTGAFQYAVRIVNDVSSSVELSLAEQRFTLLFRDAPVGIVIADRGRVTIQANEAFARMLGRPMDEVVGKRFSAYEVGPDQRNRLNEFDQVVAGTLESFAMDRQWVRADGKSVWAETITSAVRDERGAFLYAVRIVNDITERVAAQRAQDEFVAITSHELRTPLTAIHAVVGLLADGKGTESPAATMRLAAVAERNSTRMIRVVNDLLDLQRMNLDALSLAPQLCDAEEISRVVKESFLADTGLGQHHIDLQVAPVQFMADRVRVIQVLTNLVGNAVKFVGPGSPVIVRGFANAGGVRFEVIDPGPGIPPEELEAIFLKFHQVEGGDTRLPGGWGLGLAIAKSIVQAHAGQIWVESELGQGSTFIVELPGEFGGRKVIAIDRLTKH